MQRSAREAEKLAESIRRRARCRGVLPPSKLAARLGFEICRKKLADGFEGYHLEGSSRIVVGGDYTARQEATIAHEIAEAFVERKSRDREHEAFCDRVGAAIMLPRETYLEALFSSGFDLAKIRRRFPWASWEVIARRATDLIPPVASGAWVDEIPKWRRPDGDPGSAEMAAVQDARKKGRGLVLAGGIVASAWSLMPKGAEFRAVWIAVPVGGRLQ